MILLCYVEPFQRTSQLGQNNTCRFIQYKFVSKKVESLQDVERRLFIRIRQLKHVRHRCGAPDYGSYLTVGRGLILTVSI